MPINIGMRRASAAIARAEIETLLDSQVADDPKLAPFRGDVEALIDSALEKVAAPSETQNLMVTANGGVGVDPDSGDVTSFGLAINVSLVNAERDPSQILAREMMEANADGPPA